MATLEREDLEDYGVESEFIEAVLQFAVSGGGTAEEPGDSPMAGYAKSLMSDDASPFRSDSVDQTVLDNLPPVHAWLVSSGIPLEEATVYYRKLEEDGFDTLDAIKTLVVEDLDDYEFGSKSKVLVMAAIGTLPQ